MSVRIIYANTSLEGHRRLYDRLKALDSPSVRHVFLVPDRFTLGVEREIIEKVFPEGYSRVDVASFTRFAIKNVGKKINKCLSKEGTVILLEKILEDNADSLRYFKKIRGYNFSKELFAAMASLRSSDLRSEDISAVAEGKTGGLWDKLSDVAFVMKKYDEILSERYSDTISRIESLIDYVKTGAFSDVHFYVLGFNLYSAQQLSLLSALAEYGASLNVATVKSYRFFDPSSVLQPLIDYCDERGIPVEKEEAFEVVDECFERIRESIFGGKDARIKTDRVRVFNAVTPFDEITAVAREIVYLTKREGYRYKDIAVVCNDLNLLPYVREIFLRCDVPCFVDEGYNVVDGIMVKYILYLMSAEEELSPESVFRFARHPYCDLSRDETRAFCDYCVKYNIKYGRFAEPFTIGDCEEAEKVRKRILDRFVLPAKATVSEYCDQIKSLAESFSERTASYADDGDLRVAASAHDESFTLLLEETRDIFGDKITTVGEMRSLIKAAASDLKVALRPDNYDVVFVGNTEESRFSEVKALFVVGASDGVFPKKSGDGLIFTAMDNEFMKRDGLRVFPSPMERNAFGEFVVYDLMAKGMDRLYVSCSLTDLSGGALNEGDAVKEIAYATYSDRKPLQEYYDFTEEEELLYFLASDKNAYNEYIVGNVPTKFRDAVEKYLIEKNLLIKKEISVAKPSFERIFRRNDEGELITSVSQLETYFACPFKHYMKYCLKAKEPDDATLKPSVFGTAIHNVLERFFKNNLDKVYSGKDLTEETEREIKNEFSKSDYQGFYNDPLSAYLLNSVADECKRIISVLSSNMRFSNFRPVGFEVSFGYRNDDNKILIDVDGYTFRMRGKIDRVDERGDEVIIVDYKTGTVEPKLSSVYFGEKIQLYVYLGYYLAKGKRPAGVFYLPIKSGAKKGGTAYAYVGQMLDDPEVYKGIDNRCVEAEGKYVSPAVAINATVKNGEITFNKRVKNLLTEQEFNAIVKYVGALSEKALHEILAGYAEKKPLEKKCEYCAYSSMCGKVSARKTRAVDAESFETDYGSVEPTTVGED
ncbi:MAG: PD-(D/E)XK nuclease family protein [Christensenellales bacterium]